LALGPIHLVPVADPRVGAVPNRQHCFTLVDIISFVASLLTLLSETSTQIEV
jgi:hypothetical protein